MKIQEEKNILFLHADELIVGQESLEPATVPYSKSEFRRIGIVGKYRDNSGGKREHHVAAEFNLTASFVGTTEIRVYNLVEGNGERNSIGKSDGQG